MKVLHVIPSVSPVRGGPSEVALNLVKMLRTIGVDAEIATTNDNGPDDILDVPLNQKVEYKGVPVWFMPRFSPPIKEFLFSADFSNWLWQHIRDYDILDNHYLFSYASTCAGAIARLQGVPYTVRTMGQLAPWALTQSRLKKRLYSLLIEKHNLNQAAAIHCTSVGEVEDVRNFGIQTPTINLPLGVPIPPTLTEAKQKLHHIYGIPMETPIILFLSRLHEKKRPDLLLHALSKLKAQNYDFHLILAGSGEANYVNYLINLVSSLGLTTQTSLPGFVVGEDKNLLLQGSDMFALPSFSENFGIAVAEAMAVGLPVIITPEVQIAPEITASSAGMIIEGEVDTLAAAIAQLLTYPKLREQLGTNGKSLVSNRYSWSAVAQNLTSSYSAIIKGKLLPEFIVDSSAKV
ncbi:glycosyltransferase [Tolypothrix sp. FACHB-123]|uniref:glycosyltransferase n=1 Tax=Tolypothrix sp. FACHB-123 TaxID=2692868 RepID=UPI001689EEC2|nr:glycosyltransferase [Tolypothrix sp. FACHB-123]MBD2358428.1 glycosyltransferase [Tolypothrix sp. FACHB-123]